MILSMYQWKLKENEENKNLKWIQRLKTANRSAYNVRERRKTHAGDGLRPKGLWQKSLHDVSLMSKTIQPMKPNNEDFLKANSIDSLDQS